MFNAPYRFDYLGSRPTLLFDPTSKADYRFAGRYRRYLVSFEAFSFGVVAVKYCDMDHRKAANRYEQLFNDDDVFRVIATCLHIMFDFWKRNPGISLAFYAVPRKWDGSRCWPVKEMTDMETNLFRQRSEKVRFTIYKYAMVNLFSPRYFTHIIDENNGIYLLLNKSRRDLGECVRSLGHFLLDHYDMVFESDTAV